MAYVKSYKKGTYFEIPKGNAGKKITVQLNIQWYECKGVNPHICMNTSKCTDILKSVII